jgi:hypothetical protein
MKREPELRSPSEAAGDEVNKIARRTWVALGVSAGAMAVASALIIITVWPTQNQVDRADKKAEKAGTRADRAQRKAEQTDQKADTANERSKQIVRFLKGDAGRPGLSGGAGKPGAPGRAPSPAEVAQAVRAYCSNNACRGATGSPGTPGVNGTDAPPVTIADLVAAIAAYCDPRGDCRGPAGPRGQDGQNGVQGDPGTSGETGAQGPPGAQGPAGPSPSPEQIAQAAAAYLASQTFQCVPNEDPPGTLTCQIAGP